VLSVCATPIGNLDDVTLRVIAELGEADVVLAEDTRHTRGLLERHGIEAKLVYLQVFKRADLVARAERQQERTQASPAVRGDILDRRGRVLATRVEKKD